MPEQPMVPPPHPLAETFPMMNGKELASLAESISEEGQQEACWLLDGQILDGRNRAAACALLGIAPRFRDYNAEEQGDPCGFIWRTNYHRRHLTEDQVIILSVKKGLVAQARDEAKANQGERTSGPNGPEVRSGDVLRWSDRLAELIGGIVSERTLRRVIPLLEADPAAQERILNRESTIKLEKRKRDKAQRAVELAEAAAVIKSPSGALPYETKLCRCSELLQALRSEGVVPDVVITDPPYPEEFLDTFSELGEACANAGVRSVAVMSGQSWLPEVMRRLCDHLEYRWTMAYLMPGGQGVQVWPRKAMTFWKPILVFGQVGDDDPWLGDVARSVVNDNDKRFHGWGQSESGMLDLITRLSRPGDLICDPFMGAGTTGVAAITAGRRFIGGDIDPEHVRTAADRIKVQLDQTIEIAAEAI